MLAVLGTQSINGCITESDEVKERVYDETRVQLCVYVFSLPKRNVSSERSEARRKLRECTGLVDALMYIVQSQINRKDVDNKVPLHSSHVMFLNIYDSSKNHQTNLCIDL